MTDLGHTLQWSDEAAVFNLDVRKVSLSVTSVQSDLGITFHRQLSFNLLQQLPEKKKKKAVLIMHSRGKKII